MIPISSCSRVPASARLRNCCYSCAGSVHREAAPEGIGSSVALLFTSFIAHFGAELPEDAQELARNFHCENGGSFTWDGSTPDGNAATAWVGDSDREDAASWIEVPSLL